MEPKRVQLSRKRGWRMPENTVKVTRPGPFGNPFVVTEKVRAGTQFSGAAYGCVAVPTAEDAVECFRLFLQEDGPAAQQMRDRLHELRGKNLACFCKLGDPCHADVLLEIANAPAPSGGKR